MFNNTSFGEFFDITHRRLSALKYRESVITNNIANADTPNFKRSVVNFETQLKEALLSKQVNPSFEAARTHEAHIKFDEIIDYRTVSPRRFLDWQSETKNNGNNVSMEQETSDNIKNMLTYNLLTRSLNDAYKRVNIALRQ